MPEMQVGHETLPQVGDTLQIMPAEIPLYPPTEWFTPPTGMPKDAGCIVEDDGRVYGYLCHWGAILMDGSSERWTPPRSKNEYAYAHTGDTVCADQSIVKTANLGGDMGHAPTGSGDLAKLQEFYSNTQTQLARVRYGEDANGVWFAGSLWPTVNELDIARLRASARSGHWAVLGDWRDPHTGRNGYELVGACLVNVPGLKYQRADKAASGVITFNPVGETMTAIGATDLTLHEDRDAEWDGDAADQAVRVWASSDGSGDKATIDWAKYANAHFWVDPLDAEDFTGYKLGFADVFDGELHAVWSGVAAAAGALQGSRGGVDLPEDDVADVKAQVATYYQRFAELFEDATIVPPWDEEDNMEKIAASGTVALAVDTGIPVGGVLLVEGSRTEDGRFIEAGAAQWRELPLPLYSSLANLPGHDSAALVGRIDAIWRNADDDKIIEYSGVVFPASASGAGQETVDAITDQRLGGVSIDGIAGPEDVHYDDDDVMIMTTIVIAGATLTPMPAIAEATVTLLSADTETMQVDPEDTDTDAETNVQEDCGSDHPHDDLNSDQFSALWEAVQSLSERLEFLIALVEGTHLSARYESILAQLESADV